jgi:hypothetical protein
MTEQLTALRLADALEAWTLGKPTHHRAGAAELRRQHEEIVALRAALAAVRFQCEADSKAGEWTTPISKVLELIG